MNLSQSTIIFGALIFGFIVYITVKGELPKYLAVIGLSSGTSTSTNAQGITSTSSNW